MTTVYQTTVRQRHRANENITRPNKNLDLRSLKQKLMIQQLRILHAQFNCQKISKINYLLNRLSYHQADQRKIYIK